MKSNNETINEIRRFNRFYTVHMGFLDSAYLDSDYSIAETRILFELEMHGTCIQSDIVKTLHIDKSYLSRIIARFCKKGLVEKTKAEEDKRAFKIVLTPMGRTEAKRLIVLTNDQIKSQIEGLDSDECDRLCDALNVVIEMLGKGEAGYENHSI